MTFSQYKKRFLYAKILFLVVVYLPLVFVVALDFLNIDLGIPDWTWVVLCLTGIVIVLGLLKMWLGDTPRCPVCKVSLGKNIRAKKYQCEACKRKLLDIDLLS